MSSYRTLRTYNQGSGPAPVLSPIMLYSNTPVYAQAVPSYGTVGYITDKGQSYRGYSSLCAGYTCPSEAEDPSNPCFARKIVGNCIDTIIKVIPKLNDYLLDEQTSERVAEYLTTALYSPEQCKKLVVDPLPEKEQEKVRNDFVAQVVASLSLKKASGKEEGRFKLFFDSVNMEVSQSPFTKVGNCIDTILKVIPELNKYVLDQKTSEKVAEYLTAAISPSQCKRLIIDNLSDKDQEKFRTQFVLQIAANFSLKKASGKEKGRYELFLDSVNMEVSQRPL